MTIKRAGLASTGIIAVTAGLLFFMGRTTLSESGHVLLWVGATGTAEGSQQISDWYSASHFIHGILFFGGLWLFRRHLSLSTRLIIATSSEAAWELLENSPLIIDRYREATIAFGYTGDSILNSISDIVFMISGFFVTRYVPVWVAVSLVIALEVFVGYMIRDNLFLNIVMLLYPFGSIRAWQNAG